MQAEISINGLEIYAYHGLFPEENKIGNRYTVDVTVFLALMPNELDNLEKSIDYGKVAHIAQQKFKTISPLLEPLCFEIGKEILQTFPHAEKLNIKIQKHNPPIGLLCQSSSVSLTINQFDIV